MSDEKTLVEKVTSTPEGMKLFQQEALLLEVSEAICGLMKEKGIKHTTSECTLRGFTCSSANVDPKTATPAQIALIRKIQIGNQVDGITGGLAVKDQKDQKQNENQK